MLALALGILLLAYWLNTYCPLGLLPGQHPFACNAYDAPIWALEGPIGLVAPLLATLAFADSLAMDRVSGYLRQILVRCPYQKYFFTKFLINFLAGGATHHAGVGAD